MVNQQLPFLDMHVRRGYHRHRELCLEVAHQWCRAASLTLVAHGTIQLTDANLQVLV